MLEHIRALENLQAGLFGKDPGYQVLQQIADFLCHPVLLIVRHGNTALIEVEIPAGTEWRDAQDCGGVTATDASAPVGKPFIPRKIFCFHQHQRLILQGLRQR